MTQTTKFTIHKLLGDEVEKTPLVEMLGMEATKEVAEEMSFHSKVVIVSQDGDIYSSAGQKMDLEVDWLHGDDVTVTAPVKKAPKAKKAKAEPAEKTTTRKTRTKKEKIVLMPEPAEDPNPEPEPAPKGKAKKTVEEVITEEGPVRNPSKRQKKAEVDEKVYPGDFLMWVGSSSAATINDFIAQSQNGVSKKLAKVPRDMHPGETRILLAHDEGETGDAVIFGHFVLTKLTLLVEHEDADVDERYAKDDRITKLVAGEGEEPGIYAIGKELIVLNPPLDYNVLIKQSAKRYRSYMRVDGPGLLNSEAYKEAPISRSDVEVKLPEGYVQPAEGQDWTAEERQALWDHANEREDKARAFREFNRVTGRKLQGISYQYYRTKSKLDKEEAEKK